MSVSLNMRPSAWRGNSPSLQLTAQSATPSIAVSGSAVLGVTSQDIGTDGLLGLL